MLCLCTQENVWKIMISRHIGCKYAFGVKYNLIKLFFLLTNGNNYDILIHRFLLN